MQSAIVSSMSCEKLHKFHIFLSYTVIVCEEKSYIYYIYSINHFYNTFSVLIAWHYKSSSTFLVISFEFA